jgi:hypothetical protein
VCQCDTRKERDIVLNSSITMDMSRVRVPVCHTKTKRCGFEFKLINILESCASVPKKRDILFNSSITMYLSLVPVCHPKTKKCSFEFELYNILESCASVLHENKEIQF